MFRYIPVILLLLLSSCELRKVEVPQFELVESDRVVLLEEMTGVSCPNCPKGTAEIEALKDIYGDQLIPVGIHGFFLSWPTAESAYDFRNEFAKMLELNLAPGTSKPAALINRAMAPGLEERVIQSTDLWASAVEEQLKIPPRLSIQLDVDLIDENKQLTINTGILALENIDESLEISVMLLENHIIDAQEDLIDIIHDFEHNHVLRHMLTPYDGEFLVDGMVKDDIVNKAYQFTFPEEGLWVPGNMEVVVFVHFQGLEGSVLQAAVKKLVD